jgi:hypothetical protein
LKSQRTTQVIPDAKFFSLIAYWIDKDGREGKTPTRADSKGFSSDLHLMVPSVILEREILPACETYDCVGET